MNLFTGMIIAGIVLYCIADMIRGLRDAHQVYAAATTNTQTERKAARANELAARRQRFVEILHDDHDTPPAHINMRAMPDAGACARSAVPRGTNVVGGSV